MKIAYLTHSLRSCWNHGNAHFLRGLFRALQDRGHNVIALEPINPWSLQNLLQDNGPEGLEPFQRYYADLNWQTYAANTELPAMIDDADVVIVHEWNEPDVVAEIGALRKAGAAFTLLFHDTHHRAVSAPDEMRAYDLANYDGVLAFGETLSEVYRRWGWGRRVWTFHEAADTSHFRPPAKERERAGMVWVGNWGDGERTREIEHFLLAPVRQADLPLDVYGVRYPELARLKLASYQVRFKGWLANANVPDAFADYLATVHVPRNYYSTILPGIPTIRVFEALACGIPLVSAPWSDDEQLFRVGTDFLMVNDGEQMAKTVKALANDETMRGSLATHGLETILAHHTCGHRADELLAVVENIQGHPDKGPSS